MYDDPFKLGANRLAPLWAGAGQAASLRDANPGARDATIGVILAHGRGLLCCGLAALLAAEPDVELLEQVADGEAAWQVIRTREPDVAILDLALTKASGIDVVRRVAATTLGTRCLMLATHEDPSLAAQALQAGAVGYVIKDNRFEDLMLALRSIHAGGTFVSPSIAAKLRALRRDGADTLALSPREREVVRLLAVGKSSKEIARTLGISPQTVDTHRRRLMRKLKVRCAAEVVRYAVQSGLLD